MFSCRLFFIVHKMELKKWHQLESHVSGVLWGNLVSQLPQRTQTDVQERRQGWNQPLMQPCTCTVHTSAAGSVSLNQLLNFLLPNRAEGDEDS